MTNPILAFSGKRRMRSVRTPLLLTLYALALALMAYLTVYQPFMGSSIRLTTMRSSVDGYGYLLMVQFALLVLVAPAMTAGSISGERERQTLDLLLVTNTSAPQIVMGKLLESLGFLALLILCSMPMLSLVLLTGGASLGQVLVAALFLLVTAYGSLSVGLLCSAVFKRTVTATVASYLSLLAIGILTFLPLWLDLHRVDLLYQELTRNGAVLTELDVPSIAFSTNPALGLFALLRVQTGMFGTVMWSFSYTLANTMAYLPFTRYLGLNITFMAVMATIFCGLAAWTLCHKRKRQGKGKRKA